MNVIENDEELQSFFSMYLRTEVPDIQTVFLKFALKELVRKTGGNSYVPLESIKFHLSHTANTEKEKKEEIMKAKEEIKDELTYTRPAVKPINLNTKLTTNSSQLPSTERILRRNSSLNFVYSKPDYSVDRTFIRPVEKKPERQSQERQLNFTYLKTSEREKTQESKQRYGTESKYGKSSEFKSRVYNFDSYR